ncbi:PA3496 family putative envelope integrity protein [Halioxenophilus aromaticivorans]|uniref:Uncharacterized protein n=1 Tax=Halioxenophilus aromaticivorans TaxID=1306992 RepID=A0AAV3U042_9ALTE
MRDQLTNDGIDSDAVLSSGVGDDVEAFAEKNQQLDARRRLEDALEERRLSREIQEFEFDLDDFED